MHSLRRLLFKFSSFKHQFNLTVNADHCVVNNSGFWAPFTSSVVQQRKYNVQSATHPNLDGHSKDRTKVHVFEARLCPKKDLVLLTLESGKVIEFPSLWLRDNCQCSQCFNPTLNSRTIDWRTFDIEVKPTDIAVYEDFVNIVWSDQHQSSFNLTWLMNRSFDPEAQQIWLNEIYRPPKQAWNSSTFHIDKFSFTDVIHNDDCLLNWLETMAKHGIAIIENTPLQPDQARLVANRVAFIKKTHYGEEFEVKAKIGTKNLAYLAIPLQLHTDLPYYEYKPGFNMLHCLVQTKGQGGDNQITDCLNVSNILRRKFPEEYKILTEIPVEWNDIGEDLEGRFYSIYRAPAICLDRDGNFSRVNYSQQQRDSHFKIPLDQVIPWYRAHKKLTELLHDPQNTVFFKTKPGEILTFDNVRMVHGRTGYDDVEGNERHLIGVYLDWDIIYSKMRILKRDKSKDIYQ